MRAIILKDFGGVEQLIYSDVPEPFVKPGEVLIKTKAIGINPVDVKTRMGKGQAARLKEEPPMILGWDVSGEVVRVAEDVTEFKIGDAVFGMINLPGRGRAYAEFVAAPAEHLALKPVSISFEEAAAASLAAMTAWQALIYQAKIAAGQRILIHAASGGVGHYAVQFAKYKGLYVIGTSSAANREFVLSLGADEHIDYQLKPFEEQVGEVDVILDAIGGENIDRSLKVLKKGGTIVSLPSGVSEDVPQKSAAQGKKGIFFLVKSNADDIREIAKLLAEGKLVSHVDAVYDFNDVAKAHERIQSGRAVGKIIMSFSE